MAWGIYNNLLSTTISVPGVCDIDAQISFFHQRAYQNNTICTYGILYHQQLPTLIVYTVDLQCIEMS